MDIHCMDRSTINLMSSPFFLVSFMLGLILANLSDKLGSQKMNKSFGTIAFLA